MNPKDHLAIGHIWHQVVVTDDNTVIFAHHIITDIREAEAPDPCNVIIFGPIKFPLGSASVSYENYYYLDSIHENNLCSEGFPAQPTQEAALRVFNANLNAEAARLRKQAAVIDGHMNQARDLYLEMFPVGSEKWANDQIDAVRQAGESAKNSTQTFGESNA